ncbi:hypothetical protein EVAR_75895_1 [Eumeta japonica]|uniref:Uncharacterized protein n=1 Tax=Eumeta variegata TaxID=151549 RepID=A0A4C1UY18_EUMVA|nr:hypothetical protein EVAR_75895_1 [Eumeta japonica]
MLQLEHTYRAQFKHKSQCYNLSKVGYGMRNVWYARHISDVKGSCGCSSAMLSRVQGLTHLKLKQLDRYGTAADADSVPRRSDNLEGCAKRHRRRAVTVCDAAQHAHVACGTAVVDVRVESERAPSFENVERRKTCTYVEIDFKG